MAERIRAHTEHLASDELRGRGTGSKEIRHAAEYIAAQFKAIGLQPFADDSYFQAFPMPGQDGPELNVIGIVPARKATDRSLVFTAHYDAYGVLDVEPGQDSICNGAQDNAVGVTALIELARVFKGKAAPKQNLVFIATAGEEPGQYGSLFYRDNPAFAIEDVSMCLNIDGFNVSGPREDYFVMPRQGVDFLDEIESIAAPLGWVHAAPDWIDRMNTNFDTASFLSYGIPAFTLWTGERLKGGGTAEPIQLGSIHTPADEVTDQWNWDGVADHLALYESIADYFLENPDGIGVTDPELFARD